MTLTAALCTPGRKSFSRRKEAARKKCRNTAASHLDQHLRASLSNAETSASTPRGISGRFCTEEEQPAFSCMVVMTTATTETYSTTKGILVEILEPYGVWRTLTRLTMSLARSLARSGVTKHDRPPRATPESYIFELQKETCNCKTLLAFLLQEALFLNEYLLRLPQLLYRTRSLLLVSAEYLIEQSHLKLGWFNKLINLHFLNYQIWDELFR